MEEEVARRGAAEDEIRPEPNFTLPDPRTAIPQAFHALSPDQRGHIAAYACKVLEALEDKEDTLWEMDEGELSAHLSAVLGKCSDALERLKRELPRNDEARRQFARKCVQQVFHGGSGQADADRAAMDAEQRVAAQMLPESEREAFLASMDEARTEVRAQFQESMASAVRRQEVEMMIVDKILLLEAVISEAQDSLLSVDDDDLHQVATFSIAFARFSAGSLRGAVESAADTVMPAEMAERRERIEAGDRFQEVGEDGAPLHSERGFPSGERGLGAEGGRRVGRRQRRKRIGRVRLLWPSVRKSVIEPLIKAVQHKATHKPSAQDAALFAGLVCLLPFSIFLVFFFLWVVLPFLLLDEILQGLYDQRLATWRVTIQAEETLFALFAAGRVWFLMIKISVKQFTRLARKQIANAHQRPGGLAQLAQDTGSAVWKLALEAGAALSRDPAAPFRTSHGAATSLWGQAQEFRSWHSSALDDRTTL